MVIYKLKYEYISPKTTPLGEAGDKHFAYSYAAQAVEIEVKAVAAYSYDLGYEIIDNNRNYS